MVCSSLHSSSNTTVWFSICSSLVWNVQAKWLGLLKCPTTSCSTEILQWKLDTPFACTHVTLIVCTFCSNSQLMKLALISLARRTRIRVLSLPSCVKSFQVGCTNERFKFLNTLPRWSLNLLRSSLKTGLERFLKAYIFLSVSYDINSS